MGQLEAFHFISASDAERMRNCLGPSTAFRPIAPNGNSTDGRQTFFQPARFADVCIMLAPMDPRLCARVPARSSNQSRPAGDCIMLARRLPTFTQCLPTSAYVHPMFADVCIMLARSALITRWNSNQVPWDPSRELHRVPARSSNQSRPPWNRLRKLHRVPAHGSLDGTPTRSPGIHGCAYFRPMDPWLCIESRPGVCRRSPNVCRRLHTSGPVGVDHSMELQPGPLGSIEGTASSPGPQLQPCPDPMESIEGTASSPGPWIQGCASCWPGRR